MIFMPASICVENNIFKQLCARNKKQLSNQYDFVRAKEQTTPNDLSISSSSSSSNRTMSDSSNGSGSNGSCSTSSNSSSSSHNY